MMCEVERRYPVLVMSKLVSLHVVWNSDTELQWRVYIVSSRFLDLATLVLVVRLLGFRAGSVVDVM